MGQAQIETDAFRRFLAVGCRLQQEARHFLGRRRCKSQVANLMAGSAVLATDALVANGGELAILSEKTVETLNGFLPPHWSYNNPIDILGDADSERYAKAIEIASHDPTSDGLLVILAPQGMTDPAAVAERLKPYARSSGKPVLSSWMGGASITAGETILNAAGIPTFPYPDTAARAFSYMWRYSYNLRGLYETPALAEGGDLDPRSRRQAENIIETARNQGRVLLNEFESKLLLSHYGIPTLVSAARVSSKSRSSLDVKRTYAAGRRRRKQRGATGRDRFGPLVPLRVTPCRIRTPHRPKE